MQQTGFERVKIHHGNSATGPRAQHQVVDLGFSVNGPQDQSGSLLCLL
jgi:hypothetical protein